MENSTAKALGIEEVLKIINFMGKERNEGLTIIL
jgi:hypothetical protein